MSPKSRLLGRANAQKHFFEAPSGVKSPISPTDNSSSSKERVFRCLSNTAAQGTKASATSFNQVSPEERPALKQRQQLSFQPPILSSPKPQRASSPVPKTQQCEQNKRVLVLTPQQFAYYGARIDRSKEYQKQLRPGRPCCPPAASNGSDERSEQDPPKVRFQPMVRVVQIPSHRDYTERTKTSIWSSVKELKANAVRNTAEYIHDKCKWRQCTEEHDFYFDKRTQELVHPFHVERYYAALEKKKKQKQEQDRLLSQQQQEPEPMECCCNEENQQPTMRGEESYKRRIAEEQEQARQQRQQEEEEEERRRQYRKRIRCCSPSPIRRQRNPWARHYTDNDSNMVEDDSMEHQPKRPRIQAPIPCRPMASYFSQAPPSIPSSVAAPYCPSYYHYHNSVHPQAVYPYHLAPQAYAYPPAGSFPYNPEASTAIECYPLSPPTEVVGN